ncbi:MAG: hypothetical protein A2315_08615 [Ignavibacteria bacterium RIFOXYB2_FULL_35_12]|nr:MAG: hypothetical protein A2006_09780 [Ignavibacteria bacterium GWC2_35_8]OGU59753.1 MAG: hypothetical protein A2X60_10345 [Ignavibacteria bacterium GWF2_35_20]OGU80653.1 MAG: hypothetical protein A2254_13525 [Ignavibacteria bacterium RIFOXYA2_FULL_35_9]OGU85221.1 MAG: hypothetical protein A3K31_11805 [Ignavibacteria bacterium RIFOXYA12_FULL_35_25]OGU91768.1 MAG: hypothetical protein A2492_07305 [Ignavibacteria bacterium RIFOXYC12_FULL_35_11]OGU97426.1 MAG: hypothetical protein A2347_15235 
MLIKINNLKEGTHLYKLDEPIESVGLEEPFFDRVHINLSLQKLHNQIVLETELQLNAHFECDRCISDFDTNLKAKYQTVYLFGSNPDEDNESLNVTYLPADASEIVLDDDIHDYALLAVPMKKLCKDDCKGLCPECGKNLNEGSCDCKNHEVDPRWLPLQDLKNKIDTN